MARSSSPTREVRELRESYLEEFPTCQFTECLGRFVAFPYHFGKEVCVEHLFNRGRYSEHWTNYATVLPGPHELKHANSKMCQVAMLWFKQRLSKRLNDNRHFDLDVLRQITGFHIPGWVENQIDSGKLPAWCEEMGRDFLESIDSIV